MKSRSYYSLEELKVQRRNCIRLGLDPAGIEAEMGIVMGELERKGDNRNA